MSNPFSEDSIAGYNSNPPPNDGGETVENTADWDLHVVAKIGDPLKNYAQANFQNVATAITQLVGGAGITTVNTSYAVLASDRGKLINVAGGSGVTVTTPDATVEGSTFVFGVVNTSSNVVTVDGSGSQTINGLGTVTLEVGASTLLNTDGSNWYSYAAPSDPSRRSLFLTAQDIEGSVADGNVVYWNDSNNQWELAQSGVTPITGLGIADVTNGYVFGPGLVDMSFDQGALTEGVNLYLSETAGEITTTKPNIAVSLGRALSATKLWFNPQVFSPIPGQPVLIERQTASGDATIDFTTGIDGTYDEYMFRLDAVLPATDDAELRMRVSDDGGSTFETGASYYQFVYLGRTPSGSVEPDSSGEAYIRLTSTSAGYGIGTAAGEPGLNGEIKFSAPSVARQHMFRAKVEYVRAGGPLIFLTGAALETGGLAINGIRFYMNTGNIASGTFELYGVAK